MSYAAILGGMCTLIGTSTNLIMADLFSEWQSSVGQRWDPNRVSGLLCAGRDWRAGHVLGFDLHGHHVALADPRTSTRRSASRDDPRRYTVEVQVEEGGPLVGKTIEEAGLRHLPGLYIAEIQRDDGIIAAAKPNERSAGQ